MRLFIAALFSPEILTALQKAADDLRRQAYSGNFTHPENMHLTLAFIGETYDLAAVRAAVGEAVLKSRGAFVVTVGGSGRFGNLHWAGIEPNPRLAALAESVQNALRAHGFYIERRPFKPHITLARQVVPDTARTDVPKLSMPVDRICVMESRRMNGRLIYLERHCVKL